MKQRKSMVCRFAHTSSVELVQNNWLFFRLLTNAALRSVGEPWSESGIASDSERIDGFYLGRGWYRDGPAGPPWRDGRLGDYYVPLAFHFYGLLYVKMLNDIGALLIFGAGRL